MSRIKAMAAMALLAIVTVLAACGDSGQEQTLHSEDLPAPEQAHYETTQVERGTYIRSTGCSVRTYYPVNEALCWEEGNARFREILVRRGQEVKEGDCLATFDVEVSRAEKEELALSLTRKIEDTRIGEEERLLVIEEAREKTEGLIGHELRIAQLRVEKLETEYEQFVYQSERQIAQLKERIEEIEEKMANDALYAPFDGVIDSVASYNPGDLVSPDTVVVSMHATDRVYLIADDNLGRLRYNMEVTVEAGKRNDRKSYAGRVVAAPNVLPASAPQGMALIEVYDAASEDLEGSLQYQYNIEELQDVLLVDWKAISSEKGKSYVYVLEGDMVQKRYIVPALNNRSEAWVVDGLYEGQTVIAD